MAALLSLRGPFIRALAASRIDPRSAIERVHVTAFSAFPGCEREMDEPGSDV